MKVLQRLVFGHATFDEREELHEFKYKLLCLISAVASLFSLVYVIIDRLGVVRIGPVHGAVLSAFALVSLVNWRVLVARPGLYLWVAWVEELGLASVCLSGLLFVPNDELRLLWAFLNLAGTYVMLGSWAGFAVALCTIGSAWASNGLTAAHYSVHALVTASAALAILAIFFHALNSRLLSYSSRMQAYNARLMHQASHDALTGVTNTHAYYAMGDQLLALAQRQGRELAVLFIDLDHFKAINDRYGHLAGDQVLKAVARCVQARLRRSDVLGRIGGEEFSVLLPGTDCANAVQIAEDLRLALEGLQPEVTVSALGQQRQQIPITASIGIACARSSDGKNFQQIQQQADEAMYEAKRGGRNRVSVFATQAPTAAPPN